jgi:hypothetical protein
MKGKVTKEEFEKWRKFSQENPLGTQPPFRKPTDKEIVSVAILFNDGKLDKEKLSDMVAMADFIIDRLYENRDISIPSSKEDQ